MSTNGKICLQFFKETSPGTVFTGDSHLLGTLCHFQLLLKDNKLKLTIDVLYRRKQLSVHEDS